MVAVLYHSRSLCCFSPAYDVGPQLRRHNIADSEVPLSLGCCRRSAARCVGQRAVPGPDLHCALPALSLSVCITAASIRTHCTTWPPHLHMASRTCTWPTHPTSTYAPLPHRKTYPTHPKKHAYPRQNYSTSTDQATCPKAGARVRAPARWKLCRRRNMRWSFAWCTGARCLVRLVRLWYARSAWCVWYDAASTQGG